METLPRGRAKGLKLQAASSKQQAASLTSFKIRVKLKDNKGERK